MKRICFIDDNLYETCKVIEAMRAHYMGITKDKLSSTMILVNLTGEVARDTIKYFTEVFEELDTELKECDSMEKIENEIIGIKNEDAIVMVDLHMAEDEGRKIDEDSNYKCWSMRCMDKLEENHVTYFCYSSYAGNRFKDQWQRRFADLYDKAVPTIYERNDLIPAHFKIEVAKEILGV